MSNGIINIIDAIIIINIMINIIVNTTMVNALFALPSRGIKSHKSRIWKDHSVDVIMWKEN